MFGADIFVLFLSCLHCCKFNLFRKINGQSCQHTQRLFKGSACEEHIFESVEHAKLAPHSSPHIPSPLTESVKLF